MRWRAALAAFLLAQLCHGVLRAEGHYFVVGLHHPIFNYLAVNNHPNTSRTCTQNIAIENVDITNFTIHYCIEFFC